MASAVRTVIRVLERERNSHLFSKTFRSILKKIKKPSYLLGTRGCLPGGKRPTREAAHCSPFSAEVKNEWSCTYTPIFLHGLYREDFTLIFTYICRVIIKENYIGWAHITEDLINVYRNLVGNTWRHETTREI